MNRRDIHSWKIKRQKKKNIWTVLSEHQKVSTIYNSIYLDEIRGHICRVRLGEGRDEISCEDLKQFGIK